MFTCLMHTLYDLFLLFLNRLARKICVKLAIGYTHFRFIGLSVKECCGWSFFYNALRSIEIAQKFIYLCNGEICNGIKIVSTVAPLGKVTYISFTSTLSRKLAAYSLAVCRDVGSPS